MLNNLPDNPLNDPEYITDLNARLLWRDPNDEPSDDAQYISHEAATRKARFESANLLPINAAELADKRAAVVEHARLVDLAEKAIERQFKIKRHL